MTDLDKLKDALAPCPFCGGEAHWVEDTGAFETPFGLIVDHARDCFLAPTMMAEWSHIIAAWNRRAPPADLEAARAKIERLEGALGQICIDSNGDWKERRHDPQKALDDIHRLAVDAYYSSDDSAPITPPAADLVERVALSMVEVLGYDRKVDWSRVYVGNGMEADGSLKALCYGLATAALAIARPAILEE